MHRPYRPHRPHRSRPGRLAACAAALFLAAACATDDGKDTPAATERAEAVRTPEADAVFDYQLGGPYAPDDAVQAVSRDRSAEPAKGLYNVCYVNAFQTQPGDDAITWWKKKHPDLLLKDDDGSLVIDDDWEEPLLDISTPGKRRELMDVVGPWIDGCAESGHDAVEPDNLDSYERSDDLLTPEHAADFAKLLAERAHDRGLAIAQKNTTDLLPERDRIGFDFAVVEECAAYKECGDFADAYDDKVFAVEYTREDYRNACDAWGPRLSITLRDRDVTPKGTKGYVFAQC
ncbi:endo alpha-1,4 polygalactosaminidase [Streptomyces rectiviolaceus]|uniref:Endo alpha-1,4 polygalactosaminidase n=1 Tax=Streptomyces rectiviolaceus TaxID=332591 RepID=A0ABP6MYY2_9ACTN